MEIPLYIIEGKISPRIFYLGVDKPYIMWYTVITVKGGVNNET